MYSMISWGTRGPDGVAVVVRGSTGLEGEWHSRGEVVLVGVGIRRPLTYRCSHTKPIQLLLSSSPLEATL
jgi:hypothetical protein